MIRHDPINRMKAARSAVGWRRSVTRILGLLLSVSWLSVAVAEVVTIRADEWFPFNGKPDSDRPGYMIELAEMILKEHGHTVDYQVLPWLGSLAMVEKGAFDCVVGTDKVEARNFIFAEEPWGKIKSTFYVDAEDPWQYDGLGSLDHRVLGVIGSYSYGDKMDRYIDQHKNSNVQIVNANNALRQNIGKLKGKFIDTVLAFDLVMEAKLRDLGLSNQIQAAGDLEQADYIYIACSPEKRSSRQYADYFSKGIIEMRINGKLKTLLDKYGIKDWDE